MTQSSPESGNGANAASSSAVADTRQDPAMRSLYKMSRTAGVGLGDYAAVNVLAVIGVILACASVLVLIFNDVVGMLVLPAAAILVSLVAFIQIRGSNGTQTGGVVAMAGLLIAGAFVVTNVVGRVNESSSHRRHEAQLRTLVDQYGQDLIAKRVKEAYDKFDSRFREAVTFDSFERTVTFRVDRWFGETKMKSFSLGERVVIATDDNGITTATALLQMNGDGTLPNGQPLRTEEPIEFRLSDGTWKIFTIPNWFQLDPTKRQPGA